MKKLVVLMIAAIAVIGCGKQVQTSELVSATSQNFVSALESSEEMQIYKILPKHRDSNPEKRGYNVEPKEKVLTSAEISKLKKLLLNDENYHFNSRKEVPFFADVIVKVNEEYTLLISYSAKQIKIKGPDTKAKLDIDPIAQQLEHFSIQALKK